MSTALTNLSSALSERLGMGNSGNDVTETLKSTAFKGGVQVSDAQMVALLIVAQQYGLNPFVRELYAFPDNGGIVPVVSVDGWSRIMNSHDQFDGMEFKQDDQSCTCIIYRKDRSHPTSATEYMDECKRDNSPAWKSHPRRMLRHKAMIQAARLAFGFTGIYDHDEAERIIEVKEIDVTPSNISHINSGNVVEVEYISDDQVTVLRDLCVKSNSKEGAFCSYLAVESIEKIPENMFRAVVEKLNAKISKLAAKQSQK